MIDSLGFDYDKINEADDHNATPLYHAALTGNTEICQYLLQRGAVCTENDSARVFYVALTPSLRSILREWSLSAASVDPYLQSLQQNFSWLNQNNGDLVTAAPSTAEGADCIIYLWNTSESIEEQHPKVEKFRTVNVHRIMLRFRCKYLFDQLEERLDGDISSYVLHLTGNGNVHCDVILRCIEYLYIGKIEIMTLDMAFLSLQVAKLWNLHCELCNKLQSKIDDHLLFVELQNEKNKNNDPYNYVRIASNNPTKKSSWSRTTNPVILASLEVDENNASVQTSVDLDKNFLKCTISDIDCLRSDMKQLAQLVSTPVRTDTMNISSRAYIDPCSDLTIICHTDIYHVHRFRLIQHSEYFSCALKGNFIEATTSTIDLTSMICIEVSDAFPLLIQWMYADCFLCPADVTIDVSKELLHISSALLCSPRLFSYVVNTTIVPNLSVDTVFDMLNVSRLYPGKSDRLESKCCEIIASNFEEIISNEWGKEDIWYIIATEISATRQGGDIRTTDIPLVAEIRRAINRLVNITVAQRLKKLDLLKRLVEQIAHELQRDL
jgi:hypothetical protein